ncbi:MAG: hypothetical protein IPP66_20245 [Anaerolineales bacterium]|nr:hypothetical protein [Anaerolineales bacterium]
MRYRFLFILLTLSLSACSFNAELVTPPPLPTLSSTSTPNSILATATSTPMSVMELPTETPPPFPTFTPTTTVQSPPINLGVAPITFDANGTYRDVVDTLSAGTSKTYSVSALKRQVMSISVLQNIADEQWAHIPMRIVGEDDLVLCPGDCTFWRGVLPSTTTYYITLFPLQNIRNFTMRVAINPIGVATQSFQFVSADGTASFSYPDDFAPVRVSGLPVYKTQPEQVLKYIDTQAYTGTNLFGAYFMFGSSSDAKTVETCTQPASLGGPETIWGDVTITGIKFTRSEAVGIATGNIYEQVFHRVAVDGVCYEITFLTHYGNMGAYSPELKVTEFDRPALLKRFESILSTIVIK